MLYCVCNIEFRGYGPLNIKLAIVSKRALDALVRARFCVALLRDFWSINYSIWLRFGNGRMLMFEEGLLTNNRSFAFIYLGALFGFNLNRALAALGLRDRLLGNNTLLDIYLRIGILDRIAVCPNLVRFVCLSIRILGNRHRLYGAYCNFCRHRRLLDLFFHGVANREGARAVGVLLYGDIDHYAVAVFLLQLLLFKEGFDLFLDITLLFNIDTSAFLVVLAVIAYAEHLCHDLRFAKFLMGCIRGYVLLHRDTLGDNAVIQTAKTVFVFAALDVHRILFATAALRQFWRLIHVPVKGVLFVVLAAIIGHIRAFASTVIALNLENVVQHSLTGVLVRSVFFGVPSLNRNPFQFSVFGFAHRCIKFGTAEA